MLDFNNLPQPINVEVFNGGKLVSSSAARSTIWTKPRNCQNVGIICVGAGGKGADGTSGAAGTSRNGGGSGGCGAVVAVYLPSLIVPQRLYVQVGIGGGIAAPETRGSDSFVGLGPMPSGTQGNSTVCFAAGGNGGSGANGGVAGTPYGKVASPTDIIFAKGLVTLRGTTSGQTGQTSNTTGNIGSFGPTYQLTSGRAGGGVSSSNVAYLGGEIESRYPIFSDWIISGQNGDTVWEENGFLFSSRGGGGGNGNNAGQGGNGGNGGLGCGGGGGGGGLTGGLGGLGGDGVVIIVTW